MLKNKIIVKKIRNIFILFMAIIIMFGAYKNIKNSRAENVIEVDMEVADQSNSLEVQTITVDVIEKKTGNYVLELPTSVNGLIVSKYYTSSGSEIDMANENADKTIKLTNDEITNKKIQISTDYDKKDATTVETMDSENKVTATLYNKELMSAGDENGAGEGDVVVTGYMPLDAKLEVANIDLATLTSVKMSDKNQTMQKAYEISIYQKETEDAEKTEYNSSIYGETLEIKTKNLQGGTAGTIYRLPDETPTQASTGAETGNVITADMVSKVIANTTTEAMKQTIANENIQDQEYLDFAASKTSNTIKYIIATEPKTTEETNSNETAADETSNDESNIMTTATTESSNWVKASSIFESGTSSGSGKLHIGDFVNYNAGTWTQAEINNIKTGLTTGKVTANGSVNRPSSNFQFGGFAAGNSRNGNATPWTFTASNVTYGGYIKDASTGSALTGWRVFDVDGDTVTLISAGNPEDYFHPDSKYAYASEYILTGNINSSWSSTEAAKYTKRDWSNYVNSILNATSATVLSKSRLDTWFSKYISSGANTATAATYQKIYASPYTRYQNILDNYSWYYLPTSYNARSLYYSNSQYRNINYYSNYAFGVRVLVTLSSDAKFSSTRTGTKTVTGGNTSKYGGKQTYNVWGIQQKEASLKTTNAETTATSGFLGNTSIQRQNIDNVTFVNSTSGANSTKWDVSETGDGSILAWYETQANGTYKVYIGSESGTIYANTDSSYLFANIGSGDKCTSTETITNIELLNTSKTTNMKNMFSATGNTAMTKLELGKNFDTSNVTNMESMFDSMGGTAMTNLELGSNFNTSKVTNMKAMFANTGAGVMTSLNLGDKFNTSQVTDMSYMFYGTGAGAMTTLTLGDNFDTSKVKDMSNMFFATGSTAMTRLSLGDKFSTASATTMENMFAGTGGTAMTELDLGLAFTKIASTNTEIFSYCGKTGCVIYVPKEIYQDSTHAKINSTSTTTVEYTNGTFKTIERDGTLKATNTETEKTSGFLGNTNIQRQNIDNITFLDSRSGANSTKWDVSEEGNGSILAWYETQANGTYKVYIGSSGTIYANEDSSYLFQAIGCGDNCTATETITNIGLLNTTNVTNMSFMFAETGYKAMTALDLGNNFDTSNVTDMSYMFNDTGALAMTSLDLGDKFDTSNVTNMSLMFNGTGFSAMTSLNLGDKFDTSNVTDMSYMFSITGQIAMTSLNLGDKFDTSNVTDMSNMFFCTGFVAMTSLNLGDKFDTSNVTNMSYMFGETGYTAMTSLNLGDKFDTSNVTNMSYMFGETGYTAMTSLNLGDKFDTSNVTNMYNMFNECGYEAMESLDLGIAFKNISDGDVWQGKAYDGIFKDCGKSGAIIYISSELYKDRHNAKLNSNSSTTVQYVRGTFNTTLQPGTLKTTDTETEATSGFLGNTGIQRQNIENVTFTNTVPSETAPLYAYDSMYNTGSGFDSNVTTWKAIAGNQDGTINGGAWGPGYLILDGVDDWVNLGQMNFTNQLTLDATIEIDQIQSGMVEILANVQLGGTELFLKDGVPCTSVNIGGKYYYARATNAIKTGVKTRLTSTYDGTSLKIYVNGTLVAKTAVSGTIKKSDNNTVMAIGCNPSGSTSGDGQFANMNVYKVNIYDKALSETEVSMWDVSAEENSSIMGWVEKQASGALKVYIGSEKTIYANENSDCLFSYIGYSDNCTATETITNIGLLNTSNVTSMFKLFHYTGYKSMTKLDLGTNFDTSNVTNMFNMFWYCGYNSMTELNLGSKFNTSKVTNMGFMFPHCGEMNLKSLDLGENFDTSNVTKMNAMFGEVGRQKMTSLKLGNKFDTSKVTTMKWMFAGTGQYSMTDFSFGDKFDTSNVTDMYGMFTNFANVLEVIDLGDKFDTSKVTTMVNMFADAGQTSTKTLKLGDKFNTNNVTDMYCMFMNFGNTNVTTIDLGPAFVNIPTGSRDPIKTEGSNVPKHEATENMFTKTGKSGSLVIQAPEAIFKDTTHFRANTNSTTTIALSTGTINPKYRTEWTKENVEVNTTEKTMKITLRGTTNPEVLAKEYTSDVTTSLEKNNVKVLIDGENVTNDISIDVGTATQGINTTTGAKDVIQTITLSNLEQAGFQSGKSFREWSGNVSLEIDNSTLTDSYGNKNITLENGTVLQNTTIKDSTNHNQNADGNMFIDTIVPTIIYKNANTVIDKSAKSVKLIFDVTDKYYYSENAKLTLSDLTIKIDGKTPDWTKVTRSLSDETLTATVNGASKKIGKRYTLTLGNLEQLQIKEGDKYLDYSGVITVTIDADKIKDDSNNTNKTTTITTGIDLPGGEGSEEIIDLVRPIWEKSTGTVDMKSKTATIVVNGTDKYYASNSLTKDKIKVFVDGTETTGTTVNLSSATNLTEERSENGNTSNVQYGVQYTISISNYPTDKNQVKVRIPAGTLTDKSGNTNEDTDIMIYNALRPTAMEGDKTSRFLGNASIERQNIDNVTFLNNIPTSVFDISTKTYKDSTAWDVSAKQDKSIIAWYQTNANGTLKVYIASDGEISANVDSSYLFAWIGYGENCTATETITNIGLLNTSSVTNMNSMFTNTGYRAMTILHLGDNFDTSNVTDMGSMFYNVGFSAMTHLDLGDKFDTSNVTNMEEMFANVGSEAMISLDLGDKFDTGNVTDMSSMFYSVGTEVMTSLELGDKFDTSSVTNMSRMFTGVGIKKMTSLDLGDKFDTSNVTNMSGMFFATGRTAMTSLDLGDKFDTSKVTNMNQMFYQTGQTAMTSLDLGPAFIKIADTNRDIFAYTGKSGSLIIQAPEAIFQDSTHFKTGTDSETTIELTTGTINPKYRTEWIKEGTTIDTADANTPKIKIKLRGTTNTAVSANEYTSDITSSLSAEDIKVLIEGTDITDIVTKEVGTATQTTNAKTGAKDILQTVTLSNFAEISRRTGKSYKEWSGNITIEIAQKSLADKYGNKNVETTEDGTRADNTIADTTKVDKNTANAMFTDFIKPEFTYIYSDENIDKEKQTLTVEFSITDKYFDHTSWKTLSDGSYDPTGITVKLLDTNTNIPNLTKKLVKTQDITESRNGKDVKIGEKYELTISGLEQKDSAGNYNNYSGPMSITFPVGVASDKSKNTSNAQTITIGVNNPDNTGKQEIVDVVKPEWKTQNLKIDKANKKVTVDLLGTDKYYSNSLLTADKIQLFVDGVEITSKANVTKTLSDPTPLTETRNGSAQLYGVKYTLTIDNWPETDEVFKASGRSYREYSGTTKIKIPEGTLLDKSRNINKELELDIGKVDFIKPEITKVSSTKDSVAGTETIIFNVVDKYLDTTNELTADKITTKIDGETVSTITKTLTKLSDISETINGTSKVIGQQYQLVLSNFEQASIATNKNYKDYSGTVSIEIADSAVKDDSNNANDKTEITGDFVDFIKPIVIYKNANTVIDKSAKSVKLIFDVTDKYYYSENAKLTLSDLTIKIDGEIPDWTKVTRSLSDETLTATVNGASKKIGKRYTLTLGNLEQLQIKEGDKYLDYSGVITVAIDANKVKDDSNNTNKATTITTGIDLPGGEGSEEIIDVVRPIWEKSTGTVDMKNKTATIVVNGTDKYYASNSLTKDKIKVLVDGTETTGTTVNLSSATNLTEERSENGNTSNVQYGVQYTISISNYPTDKNQVKIRIPAGTLTDKSGNTNEDTDIIIYNTLKTTNTEQNADSGFLGNTTLERQNIENVTFLNNIPTSVFDISTKTYKDSTAWDVSATQDKSIIAWYETNANGTVKVYIGSDDAIFGNVDSSYLFAWVGNGENCTATETITNIGLLNTTNVTNMNRMFTNTGYRAMTSLNLGDKFDTSNVTDMSYMFFGTGYTAMTSLDLGDKFNTSNVTNMEAMFMDTGYTAMTELNLESKFNTSNVITMEMMFDHTGYTALKTLDLGFNFDTSKVKNMGYMFQDTGYTLMESLKLGDKFDTSNVQKMSAMFNETGVMKLSSLDLGDKFYTSKVTSMTNMFRLTGNQALLTLDLGPAFTQIPEDNSYFCWNAGKYGKLVIYAPEAIFQDKNNFKLNTDATTSAISYTRGTINPKYRTEWIKEGTTIDTADANTPKIKIKLRGTTNTAVSANEYTSDVTSALSAGNIKVLIEGTDITDIVTKEVGTATQTTNAKTGAKDILQEVTLSNFAEISRRTGKNYIEWSGNITVEVAQKSLADKYGNKNITITDDGARADNTITDTTKVDKNTANAMFTDFIKPEFTYVYTDGNINQTNKTLTVEFSVIDKYFDASTVINKKDGIIVKLLDADTQIPDANITKEITKIEDVTETREDSAEPVKIGEKYRLVIGGLQETDIATGAKYRNYSGPMSITFPEGIATDKSKNTNIAKTITIGVNDPANTGTQQIVDVVDPMWKTENINIDKANKIVTVDLVGTDKYFDGTQTKLTTDGIKVYIDENEVTSTENVTKQLSEGTELKEERTVNGTTTQVPYGVRYTLTLSNWPENDTTFNASGRTYREYSGTTKIEIPKGTLTDKYKNTNQAQTFTLGDIDFVKPEITKVSSTKGDSTETIIFNVIDKHLDTTKELNADDISVLVDKESASSVTKTLTKLSDITATVNETTKTIGQQYQLVLSNFKQERQSIDSSRNYTDWSGTVSIEIQEGAVQDTFENTNEKTTIDGDFVDFIEPEITYKYSNSDIDYTGKTFTMAIEVIDKYFAESSTLTTENLKNYLTIKVDGEDITDNDKITKEIIATENVLAGTVEKPINKTIDGKIQVGLTNQTVGKRYTLRISNLQQTIKNGEYLDYSGVITVALKAGIVKDTSDNRNVPTTISSGVDFPGGTGDGKIVDVVDPLWEQVGTATATPIKQTASIILKGTDKYLDKAKSKLTASQIKVLVNGQEQTSGITLEVTEDTSVSLTYGRQYKINVSGFISNAYQVKLVVAANSLVDSSGNKSKEQEFILYSCLRKTDTETTATSPFLGNDKIQRQKVEKVILEDYANYTDDTRWDVSAQEDGSIIAWYETTPRNTYIVHIGSSIIMNGNENSSYLFAYIGYDSACAETSEESNPIIENIGLLHVDNVTTIDHMFTYFGYSNMKTFSLGKNFDVGAIQNVYEMFSYCGYKSMETLDLGEKFNPKSATDMQNMFAYCGYTAMTSLDLGDNFNTITVTNMNGMFHHTGYMKMKKLDLGENFDTKNVTDMRYMFMSCGRNAMEALDLGDKFDTTKVTVYKEMFRGCGYQSMTRLDLGDNFNTSNGKDMSGMFQNCGVTAMTSLDLGDKFYTTSSTDMTNMFNGTGTTAMTTLDLGSGFTKIATKHDNMFTNCGNANLVVYSPELIYSSESAFKMGR